VDATSVDANVRNSDTIVGRPRVTVESVYERLRDVACS
jgi:hypothetical protein